MHRYLTACYDLNHSYDEFKTHNFVTVLAQTAEAAIQKREQTRLHSYTRKNGNHADARERDNAHYQHNPVTGLKGCAAWRVGSAYLEET